eukprot:19918-Heterococcus_DN1.PRE.1
MAVYIVLNRSVICVTDSKPMFKRDAVVQAALDQHLKTGPKLETEHALTPDVVLYRVVEGSARLIVSVVGCHVIA